MSGVTEWICPNHGTIHKWYDGTGYLGINPLEAGPKFCSQCGSPVEKRHSDYGTAIWNSSGTDASAWGPGKGSIE
jgi:hypothetical protein